MKAVDGDGYSVEHRWREQVLYWEGDRGFLFDGGWGVHPAALYVPSPDVWLEVMPEWLRHRRDEVLARLRMTGDTLVEDVHGWYRHDPEGRMLTR